jgi:hypothetical protein
MGEIRLRVTGAVPEDGTTMQVLLNTLESEEGGPRREIRRSAPLSDGVALLTDVPAGRYELAAFPSKSLQRETSLVDGKADVLVRPGGTSEATCSLVLGGNVRFRARAPQGHLVSVACSLHDAEGQEVDTNFHTRLPNGDGYGGGWALTDRGPNELVRNLAPGTYTVRLRHEAYRDLHDVVEIVPGEVTERIFELVAR